MYPAECQRTHKCPHCGYIADRDHNTATNILTKGLDIFRLSPTSKGVIVNSTKGHASYRGSVLTETGVKSPNPRLESDLLVSHGNIEDLSCLVKCRIRTSENPSV
ncbi:MAG: zinc ribbon domain-containing protein [Microcoleaceae cyanobacterium]